MTATEELRRMLNERGVHWWSGEDEQETLWESNGLTWEYSNNENGDAWLGFLGACEQDITPEQAIEATLGRGMCVPAELDCIEDRSRWFELFGTPERAARTLKEFELDQINWCRGTDCCEKCPYEFDRYGCSLPDGFALLEWLRGDAE